MLIPNIVSQSTPFPPPKSIPIPIIAPIVACVVEIGSPKALANINQIAVDINMVKTTAFWLTPVAT
ncbi:hypothetical protein ES705_45231 [subsurface metagenome]